MSDIAGEEVPRRWTTSRVEAFFGIIVFPKAAAIAYLVVAAEGVLLLGGKSRFSLRRLLSRA